MRYNRRTGRHTCAGCKQTFASEAGISIHRSNERKKPGGGCTGPRPKIEPEDMLALPEHAAYVIRTNRDAIHGATDTDADGNPVLDDIDALLKKVNP